MRSSLALSGSATPTASSIRPRGADGRPWIVEETLAALTLAAMVVVPLAEIVVRRIWVTGIPGAAPIVQHLTLWVGFLGAALAARDGHLLALATGTLLPGALRPATRVFANTVAAAVTAALWVGAVQLVIIERQVGSLIALRVPVWTTQLVLPVALAAVAARLVHQAGTGWTARAIAAGGIVSGLVLVWQPSISRST